MNYTGNKTKKKWKSTS